MNPGAPAPYAYPAVAADLDTVDVHGMSLARLTEDGLLDHVFQALEAGRGGWVVTANLDFSRRHARDPEVRALYDAADVRVADGMPLVWASRLQGDPLPERVAGSSVAGRLAAEAARRGRSLYLLGGDPGHAEAAAARLVARHPGLRIAGTSSPFIGAPPSHAEVERIADDLRRTGPDVVLVAFGSPKQEYACRALRARFPATWFLGVGITLGFLAGDVARAPGWLQRAGLEWTHRLAQDPRRLARRYLVDGLPFAAELLGGAALRRVRGGAPTRGRRP